MIQSKRNRYVLVFAALSILFIPALSACAAEPRREGASMEFRNKFISEFRHIMLDTSADDAMFLRIMVQASKAKRGIEVGTARAFGAMNMGIGFERNKGHLYTVDISHDMVVKARANLETTALEKTVTVIEGDALKVLPGLKGEYDFIFLDAVKRDYMKYLEAVEDNLVDGSIVMADNTIRSAGAMRDFLDHLFRAGGYDAITVRSSMEKKDGVTLAWKIPAGKKAAASESRLKRIESLKAGTALDPILLRILVEASGAKNGAAVAPCSKSVMNMGIAFERTGGLLRVKGDISKEVVDPGPANWCGSLDKLDDRIDFLFMDGKKADYFKNFKAVEKKLCAGALIVADSTLVDAVDAKDLLEYFKKSPDYEVVTLRAEDSRNKDGMTLAYRVR